MALATEYREKAVKEFFEALTAIIKSLQPMVEHAVKEYLEQKGRR